MIYRKMTCVPMEEAHLDALAAISAKTADPWSRDSLAAELGRKDASASVLLVDGEPMGFVCFRVMWGGAELLMVALDESLRGQGLGTQFLRGCVQALAKDDVERVILEVRESNAPAIRVYEKMGFELLCRRENFYEKPAEDGFTMELQLAPAAL